MPIFKVIASQLQWNTFVVEAQSADHAEKLVMQGTSFDSDEHPPTMGGGEGDFQMEPAELVEGEDLESLERQGFATDARNWSEANADLVDDFMED